MPLARSLSGKPWAVLATAVLLLGTSAGKKMSPHELRTARLEEQVAALEGERMRLQRSVDSLTAVVSAQTAEMRQKRAVSDDQVSRLVQTVQSLQADVEALRLDQSELRDRIQFEQSAPGAPAAADAAGADNPRALYEAAYQDLSRGDHDLALMGFQEVLKRYPTAELADNAQYWIGEVYYDRKDYARALEEFLKVEANHPSGDKIPAALLKAGMTQQQLGKHKAAAKTFEILVARFPSTEEARLARAKLTEQ